MSTNRVQQNRHGHCSALLKNKGLITSRQKTLDLVKIGADLSATYGGTAKDAIEALNAAMRGESDPIERYGIQSPAGLP